ncbi:MAG: transcriptional repressor LexA [Planctomycetaceae bacterium]
MPAKTQNPPKRKRGRPRIKTLTESQRRTLSAIERYIAQQGIPPTMQELAEMLDVTTSGAYDQVNQLVRKGYVRRRPRQARGLTVLRRTKDEGIADLVPVPLVGSVAAGQPMWAEEDVLGEVLVPGDVARKGRCFALKIKGDSMTGAGIHDGDVVVVRQQQLAQNGDIVVALVDNEDAFIKRLYWSEGTIELRPENRKHPRIRIGPEHDLRILGIVVAHSNPR